MSKAKPHADLYKKNKTTIPNIDYHNKKETSFWKDFLLNPDYEVEKLDLYEGALYTVAKGIYRPSFSSIMKQYDEDYYYYNAPSRLAIYKRIMELSGEDYFFEDFFKYDKKNVTIQRLPYSSCPYLEQSPDSSVW